MSNSRLEVLLQNAIILLREQNLELEEILNELGMTNEEWYELNGVAVIE